MSSKVDISRDEEATVASTPDIGLQMSKMTIIKNLAMISACILLTYTAVSGTVCLQSSLNADNNLGNNSVFIMYLSGVVCNLCAVTLVVYKLGLKWTMIVSLLMHALLPASNYFSTWYSLYPGAAITGLFMAPLWNAKSVYLTLLGEKYAQLNGEPPEVVVSLFFGIFFMVYRGSIFTGNIVSSLLIHRPPSTYILADDDDVIIRSLCGANYCYEDLDVAFGRQGVNATNRGSADGTYHPSTFQRHVLFGIYVLCTLLSVAIVSTVDPIHFSREKKSVNVLEALLVTMNQMKRLKEILLIPLAFLSGVNYSFVTSGFCLGFVTCSLGVDNVGYVMSVFGATGALGSVLLARLHKYVGRKVIFAIGGLCNAASIVAMLTWTPGGSHSLPVMCVLAALWAIALVVWTSQLLAFVAFVFADGSKEAAFSCNSLWQMLGISLWFLISSYMCLHVQLYIIAAILAIGLFGYAAVEWMLAAELESQTTQDVDQHQTDK